MPHRRVKTNRPRERQTHDRAREEDGEVERVLPAERGRVGVVREVMQQEESQRDECGEQMGVDVDGLVVQV